MQKTIERLQRQDTRVRAASVQAPAPPPQEAELTSALRSQLLSARAREVEREQENAQLRERELERERENARLRESNDTHRGDPCRCPLRCSILCSLFKKSACPACISLLRDRESVL